MMTECRMIRRAASGFAAPVWIALACWWTPLASAAAPAPASQQAGTEWTLSKIEARTAEIVRVYVGLRQIVNPQAADECCKEMITQLVVPIWKRRDQVSQRELAQQLVTVYDSLTYEFRLRAARDVTLKKLYAHFEGQLVAPIVPRIRGYRRR